MCRSCTCREELAGVRRQLQDKERQLTSGQAAVRDTETRLQELRSKIAGYEDTQQAYQASVFAHLAGPCEPCSPCLAQHQFNMHGKTGCGHLRTVVSPPL